MITPFFKIHDQPYICEFTYIFVILIKGPVIPSVPSHPPLVEHDNWRRHRAHPPYIQGKN